MESTFPTNQVLNFDFTHEVNLFSVLTAFGMKQFAPLLDQHNYQANRELIVSHMVPFGCKSLFQNSPHLPIPSIPPTNTFYFQAASISN